MITVAVLGISVVFGALVVRLLPGRMGRDARAIVFGVSFLLCAAAAFVLAVAYGALQP